MSVTLVVLKNPFNPNDRDIYTVDVGLGRTLQAFLEGHAPANDELEYHASINGKVYGPDELEAQIVHPGDFVAVCPVLRGGGGNGGKNPLAILAGIALAMFSFGVVGPAVQSAFAGSAIAGQLAAGATLMIGGQLISSVFAPQMKGGDDDQSHRWGALQPISDQGAVIPITYGTVRTAGQIVNQHIRVENDVQYMELLLCGGEGMIDEFSDIRVNGNPVENYEGTFYDTRPGSNGQTPIEGFEKIYDNQFVGFTLEVGKGADGNLNKHLPGEWMAYELEGDALDYIEVTLDFPEGMGWFPETRSGPEKHWVEPEFQYSRRESGGSWGGWVPWFKERIEDATTKPFTRVRTTPKLMSGKYRVRARMFAKDGVHPTKDRNKTVWTSMTAVVEEPMVHPGKALLGIRIRATDQISGGMPTVTWRQARKAVLVYDGGRWVRKDAQNPAWIVYDLCVRAKDLDGVIHVFGEKPERMDLPAFKAWAQWNDRQIGNRPALKMNLLVDESKNLWDWVNDVATSARGSVVMRGTKISCMWDQPSEPVQLFSMGNILAGSFSGEFLPMESRANAVEISFLNEAKNFEREQITVYADGFDNMDGPANPVSVQLVGITNFEQAWREGLYRLNQNKYILRTISFTADIDAIACQAGDVILVQHDVPQWGQGGRILSVSGNTLKLDRAVILNSGASYRILIRKQDHSIIERTVSSAHGGETDTISISGAGGVGPDDVFSIGEVGKVAKPFRIQEMSRNGDLFVTMTCTEYIAELYTESGAPPGIDYSEGVNRIANLVLTPSGYYSSSGQWVAELWATWSYRGKKPVAYEVEWKHDNDVWGNHLQTQATTAQCPLRETTSLYSVRVRALYAGLPPSEWAYATSEGIVLGNGIPPDPPTNLKAVGWMGFASLSWTNPQNVDLSHIEVWEAFEDDRSKAVQVGQTRADTFTRLLPAGGVAWYWVRAVNYTGQKSDFNSEAGTPCIIDPDSFQSIIDELLKDPAIKEAIEELQKPIDEIRDIAEELSETLIKNSIRDYGDFWQQKLAERAAEKLAEAKLDGSISEWEGWNHTLAAVADETEKREKQGEAFAKKVEGVVVMIGDPVNPGPDTVYGAIKDEMEARATLDEVTGKRINEVLTVIGDPLNPTPDSVYGAIRTEEKARAAKDEATAERMDTIAAIIGDPANPQPGSAFAAIQEEAKTRAAHDEAEAKRVNELQAKLTTDLGEVRASIQREEQVRAGQDSALASSISTVQSRLNGNIASVQTLARAVDGYGTKWATKLDSNGYITGLVMVNNGQGKSATVFHTDSFLVGKPGVNGGSPQYAFVIGKVNGRYQVAMNSAFIQDLSVDTLKIQGRAVTIPEGVSGISAVPWGKYHKDVIGVYYPLLYPGGYQIALPISNVWVDQPVWVTFCCEIQGYAATIGFRVLASVNGSYQGTIIESVNGWTALNNEVRSGTFCRSGSFKPDRSGTARIEVDWRITATHGGRDFNQSSVADFTLLAMQCKR